MKERFKVICGAFLVLIRDNKILLLRRANTGFADGMYSVPAGHVEMGESVLAAAIREAKEEIGLDLEPQNLEHVHVMSCNASDGNRVHQFFLVKDWKTEPVNAEPDKCDQLTWVSLDELPDNIIPYIHQMIECVQREIRYSEIGW